MRFGLGKLAGIFGLVGLLPGLGHGGHRVIGCINGYERSRQKKPGGQREEANLIHYNLLVKAEWGMLRAEKELF